MTAVTRNTEYDVVAVGGGAAGGMAETTWLDATAQADLVRGGEVSAKELVEAAIARIEAVNPRLDAVIRTWFEAARPTATCPTARSAAFRSCPRTWSRVSPPRSAWGRCVRWPGRPPPTSQNSSGRRRHPAWPHQHGRARHLGDHRAAKLPRFLSRLSSPVPCRSTPAPWPSAGIRLRVGRAARAAHCGTASVNMRPARPIRPPGGSHEASGDLHHSRAAMYFFRPSMP
jgi:hypothetical protein